MDDLNAIAAALDERHAFAQRAFNARDLAAYTSLFEPSLRYRRADGRVIGRDELVRDVARQFRQLSSAQSSFVRDALHVEGEDVVETLAQTAMANAIAFGVAERPWRLERRADYVWRRYEGVWLIVRVHVHSETLVRRAWRLRI